MVWEAHLTKAADGDFVPYVNWNSGRFRRDRNHRDNRWNGNNRVVLRYPTRFPREAIYLAGFYFPHFVINGIENFLGYTKTKLRKHYGISRNRFFLYLRDGIPLQSPQRKHRAPCFAESSDQEAVLDKLQKFSFPFRRKNLGRAKEKQKRLFCWLASVRERRRSGFTHLGSFV